jgi:hypothetical protein
MIFSWLRRTGDTDRPRTTQTRGNGAQGSRSASWNPLPRVRLMFYAEPGPGDQAAGRSVPQVIGLPDDLRKYSLLDRCRFAGESN